MRIHRLEVQAFGPFAERVALDVDDLTAGGLFLVHGPTGSGKTSLLDAVCFALYADVPGSRSSQSLRSHHAAPEAVPEVLLEVTVGGRRLRLTRSPAWQRPKRRGTGLTPVPARVLLEERGAQGWATVSTRNDEVADVVRDALGMGLAQFAKVVLLPQGDFAAFLRATPEERREVLERLFDIEVFSGVEDWLVEQRRALGARVDAERSALAADLGRVEDALADCGRAPDPPLPAGEEGAASVATPLAGLPPDDVPARLAELAGWLDAAVSSAMADADAAAGAERAAQAALAAGRARAAARSRGLQARARAAALVAGADEHEQRVADLAAAERAATVSGHLLAHDRARKDRDAAADLVAEARAGSAHLVDTAEEPAVEVARRLHALDAAAADIARGAESARTVARAVAEADERLTAVRARYESAAEGLAEATVDLADRSEEVAALAARAAQAPEHRLHLDAARARLAILEAVEADRRARADLAPGLAAARDGLLAAQGDLIVLRQRRLDGMAAELAQGLHDAGPCPVCGATEHPAPAVASDPVSADDLADAESRLDTARAACSALEADDTRLAAAVEARQQALTGADRNALEAALTAAEQALGEADRAAAAHDEADRQVEALRSRVEALGRDRGNLDASSVALTERLDELGAQAEGVRAALADALYRHQGCPCGSEDPGAHTRAAAALDALERADAGLVAAEVRLAVAVRDLDSAVAQAGFAGADAARHARRPDGEVAGLREAVAAHVRDADACRAVLEEPEVAAALEGDPPDLEALEEATRVARRGVLATTSAQDALTRAGRTLGRLRPGLEAACAGLVALCDRHARVRELADAVAGTGGDNALRMRLSSFVLAARLEKVAALANERLRVMGSGRYLLEHTDDRAARGARSGLGLRVLDQWTGRVRGTASLSGGESFMASLALALGLADAVREESGGLDLGTLFVDEGFGSLDEDSLEQVLTVLDGLREGGRAVGVVSHVADLRARIPHQAVVHKGTTGSTVQVRTDSGAAPAA